MTAKCKLDFGRGQELKPFFLLYLDIFQRPFSHISGHKCKSHQVKSWRSRSGSFCIACLVSSSVISKLNCSINYYVYVQVISAWNVNLLHTHFGIGGFCLQVQDVSYGDFSPLTLICLFSE